MSGTNLMQYVLVNELAHSHQSLGPCLICVARAQFHGDSAAACNLSDVFHTVKNAQLIYGNQTHLS